MVQREIWQRTNLIQYIAATSQTNTRMRLSAIRVLEAYDISEPPVNIYAILKDQEIEVDFWQFSNRKLDGLFVKDFSGLGIGINANHPRMKQRFTAAHEFKHHLHDVPDNGGLVTSCMSDDPSQIERKANAFAAELLMPPALFHSAYQELGVELVTVNILAAAFRVSYEATVYRLSSLGYISDQQTKKLLLPDSRRVDLEQMRVSNYGRRLARIRTRALLAAFGNLEGLSHCYLCSASILDNERICLECGAEQN